ncbi:MAG TPA: class I SAM-dependent methyltransferase, partial [Verrucomicrobiota bacterium]|nr:class I SAM-dependent methyltransferase [Verrucomicrobiota bacterium]
LATGERDVAGAHGRLRRAGAAGRFAAVLDFGCGVGRLARAWADRAEQVTGVDISASMLEHARRILADRPDVRLVHNEAPDLRVLPDASFDLVYSLICLQHMPWPVAAGYLGEFARVCRPGGWVAFQLPARGPDSGRAARWRKRLVDALPFGLAAAYRRWRHGSSAVFDVFYTPRPAVEARLQAAGLAAGAAEPDASAGPGTEGYFYLARKAA